MKAIVVTAERKLELREIREPEPGPFEALVRIMGCGICSTTDSEIIRGTQPYHNAYPCILGHEAVGEVVAVGRSVRRFRRGDRVTRPVALWPGSIREDLASGWGGFAEYGIVRDRLAMADAGDDSMVSDYTALRQNVVPPGLEVPHAIAAIALAETLSWCRNLGGLEGATVCVAGTGIAGLSIAMWAKHLGAKRVVVLGRRDSRLELARQLGADDVINVTQQEPVAGARNLVQGGFDLFAEATGQADQLRVACGSIRVGGTVAVYGVAPHGVYDLKWSWLPAEVRLCQPAAEEHLAYGDVATMILARKVPIELFCTHRWPLAAFASAFESVWRGDVVKGVIEM